MSEIRVWARRNCEGQDENFKCESGSCGPNIKCENRGPMTPVTQAVITLSTGNNHDRHDSYYMSLVNGYNIPILIIPIEDTYMKRG
uniref:Uncharacterized protein n=1 Tax=Acrobeloides nanus TaxID=290746 RepID=A0A914EMJ0_9BILA